MRLLVLSNQDSGSAFARWLQEGASDIEIIHHRESCRSEAEMHAAIARIKAMAPQVVMVKAMPPPVPDERVHYHRFQQMCQELNNTIKFFDPIQAWHLEYDKFRMQQALQAAELPVPESLLVTSTTDLDQAQQFAAKLGFDRVLVKPNRGADGRGVVKPDSISSFSKGVNSILSSGDQAIIQRYIDTEPTGVSSLRIMCVGTSCILTLYCKEYNLLVSNCGPELKILTPDNTLRTMAESIAEISGLNFSGIDILQDTAGGYWVLETNSSPSFRILLRSGADLNPLRDALLSKGREIASST